MNSFLPQSLEAERAVLACILLNPANLVDVAARLGPDDFYAERHQMLFCAMQELDGRQEPIDYRTLQAHLEDKGQFDIVGGVAYMAGLDVDLPDMGGLTSYVEIVKERSVRRKIIERGELILTGLRGETKADEALSKLEQIAFDLGGETCSRDFASVETGYHLAIEAIERRSQGPLIGLPSGFYDWDYLTQGLCPGHLIVVAGRPGSGKTSVMLDVVRHAAFEAGKSVGVFSLEMTTEELVERLISSQTEIPYAQIRAGRLSKSDWEKATAAMNRTCKADLYIDDSPSPSLPEITAKARRLKAKHGLDLLCVDYLSLIATGTKNRQAEVANLSRGFKELAKTLEVPVLLLQQLNRQPESRSGDHRPKLADLRESGAIEQDADQVCFVYRDEMYNKDDPDNRGLAELIVEKHRQGETGTVHLLWCGEIVSFKNLDRNHWK